VENWFSFETNLEGVKMIIEHEGKKYLKIGDKAIPLNADGKPNIKCTSTEKCHPDGRVDCTIHVPCLQIASKANK